MANHPNRSWRSRLLHQADELGPDMVSAWLSLRTRYGISLVSVAAALSAQTDVAYDNNRLLKWRRGAESVPRPVAAIMRRELLQYLLDDEQDGSALARLMEGPARQ